MGFIELLESEYVGIDSYIEYVLNFLQEGATEQEFRDIVSEAYGDDITEDLMEAMVKRVSSDGRVRKTRSAAVRKRKATMTTGMSKAKLKLRARKSARTRKRSPGTVRRGIKKRRKAMRRRKQMGL